ncbi:MAG: hypothetical protein IJH86_11520 [Clostridia bacterium]|nr:hypothetical protein [Clostridia bacterium]
MRRIIITLLLLIIPALSGCAVTGEVENQAYALVMGVDQTSAGGIDLTIRIPRIGHGDSGGEGAVGKGEPYLVLTASGDDYAQAMEHLQWAAARELNLSHLNLLIVSESLASGQDFPALIREIADTRHLYANAGFVVCEGRAGDFIEGQETLLGSHLSSDISAMFRHYAAHGFIPGATFADLYYATLSCYSDPTGIWGFPDSGEQAAAAIIDTDEAALNVQTKTASSRQYLGTALFRDGVCVGRLDGAETLCLNLLTRQVAAFGFEADGRAWALSSTLPPRVRARRDGEKMIIDVTVSLTGDDPGDPTAAEAAVERSITRVVERCKALRVEPFGFAAKAAAHFATLDDWLSYDWRARFPEADVRVKVHIAAAE